MSVAPSVASNEKPSSYYQMINHTLAGLVPEEAVNILDIGCGGGLLGGHLKTGREDRRIWGIEVIEEAAHEATQILDHVITGSVESCFPLECAPETFDCIIFGDVLEHLVEPKKTLQAIRPYLTENGCVVVCVPNISHWSVIVQLLQGQFTYETAGLLDATHLRFFTPSSFRQILLELGFGIETELSHLLPQGHIVEILAHATEAIGGDPEITRQSAQIYQRLYRARKHPSEVTAIHHSDSLIELQFGGSQDKNRLFGNPAGVSSR